MHPADNAPERASSTRFQLLSSPFRAATSVAVGLLAVSGGIGVGGCETLDTSGSGDSYSYVMGDMSATEDGTLPTAMEAARTVLESSGYRVSIFTRDDVRGSIVAEKPQGREAQMEFEQMGLERVRMKVRVGVVGDRDESRRILDAIRLRL
jgi:hypothetical protein